MPSNRSSSVRTLPDDVSELLSAAAETVRLACGLSLQQFKEDSGYPASLPTLQRTLKYRPRWNWKTAKPVIKFIASYFNLKPHEAAREILRGECTMQPLIDDTVGMRTWYPRQRRVNRFAELIAREERTAQWSTGWYSTIPPELFPRPAMEKLNYRIVEELGGGVEQWRALNTLARRRQAMILSPYDAPRLTRTYYLHEWEFRFLLLSVNKYSLLTRKEARDVVAFLRDEVVLGRGVRIGLIDPGLLPDTLSCFFDSVHTVGDNLIVRRDERTPAYQYAQGLAITPHMVNQREILKVLQNCCQNELEPLGTADMLDEILSRTDEDHLPRSGKGPPKFLAWKRRTPKPSPDWWRRSLA